jgi:peroxiredoxin Q/BCP
VVLGISPDSPRKHRKFKEKYQLPYTLLADEDHAVAEQYGVWQLKKFMGRSYMGVARTTFIIDPKGVIAKVFEKVNPDGHGVEVADAIASMGG